MGMRRWGGENSSSDMNYISFIRAGRLMGTELPGVPVKKVKMEAPASRYLNSLHPGMHLDFK